MEGAAAAGLLSPDNQKKKKRRRRKRQGDKNAMIKPLAGENSDTDQPGSHDASPESLPPHDSATSDSDEDTSNTDQTDTEHETSGTHSTHDSGSASDLNEVNSGKLSALNTGDKTCMIHLGEQFVAFCKTCEIAICIECVTGDEKSHSLHETISISKLVAQNNAFETTRQALTASISSHEDVKQETARLAVEVRDSHQEQETSVLEKEKEVLVFLDEQLEAEVTHMRSCVEDHKGIIKKQTQNTLQEIRESQKQQEETLDKKLAGVEAAAPLLSKASDDLKQKITTESLPTLVLRNKEAKMIMSQNRECENKPNLTGPVVKDYQKIHDLGDLRDLFRQTLPASLDINNRKNQTGNTSIMISRHYHVSGYLFGHNLTTIYPGPIKGPDLSKPLNTWSDVTYLSTSDATQLRSTVGASSWVLRTYFNRRAVLQAEDGVVHSYGSWITDKFGNILTNKHDVKLYIYLPGKNKLIDVVEDVIDRKLTNCMCDGESRKLLDPEVLVEEWGRTSLSWK